MNTDRMHALCKWVSSHGRERELLQVWCKTVKDHLEHGKKLSVARRDDGSEYDPWMSAEDYCRDSVLRIVQDYTHEYGADSITALEQEELVRRHCLALGVPYGQSR